MPAVLCIRLDCPGADDLANSNRQAGYSLYNARVGIAASTFEIMFWGRNLGDKLYMPTPTTPAPRAWATRAIGA